MVELTDEQRAIVDEMEAIDERSRYWLFRARETATGEVSLKELLDERSKYDQQQLANRRPEPDDGDSVDVREDEGDAGT